TLNDSRKLIVAFNDGGGVQTLQTQTMSSVPYAIEAKQVSGYDASHLLRVDGVTATALNSTQYTELTSLIGGTSTQYTKANQLGGVLLGLARRLRQRHAKRHPSGQDQRLTGRYRRPLGRRPNVALGWHEIRRHQSEVRGSEIGGGPGAVPDELHDRANHGLRL